MLVHLQGPQVSHKIHLLVLQLRHKLDVKVGELMEDLGPVEDAQALGPMVVYHGVIWLHLRRRSSSASWSHDGE